MLAREGPFQSPGINIEGKRGRTHVIQALSSGPWLQARVRERSGPAEAPATSGGGGAAAHWGRDLLQLQKSLCGTDKGHVADTPPCTAWLVAPEISVPGVIVTRLLDRKRRPQSLVFLLQELKSRGSCKEIDAELLNP